MGFFTSVISEWWKYCIIGYLPNPVFTVIMAVVGVVSIYKTHHQTVRRGGGVKVGKTILNHVQTKILREETMSEQKKLTRAVGPRGVPRRPLAERATNSSPQGPESFWNHPTARASRSYSPVLFPVLRITWNCEFLCVIDLNRTLWNFMVFYLFMFTCLYSWRGDTLLKVWVLIFWDGDGSKEGQEGQEQCDMWEFPERGICTCRLWSTSLPPGRFYIRTRLKSPLRDAWLYTFYSVAFFT